MPYFVGLDASKKTTHICVIDRDGAVVDEGVVETSPKAIATFLRGQRRRYVRVGMEAWSIAAWLYDGLSKAGLPIVSIEARSAHAFLKENRNKTDRNDARGIAQPDAAGPLPRRAHEERGQPGRFRRPADDAGRGVYLWTRRAISKTPFVASSSAQD